MDKDKFHEQDEKNKLDIFPKLVDCILLVITICIILFIIIEIVGAFIIGIKLSKEIHVKETIELYSIGTGDKIKGSFSMYHGSIEEVDTIVAIERLRTVERHIINLKWMRLLCMKH